MHIRSQVENDLSDSLKKALMIAGDHNRELGNNAVARLAAAYSSQLVQAVGRTPTQDEIIDMVDDIYAVLHNTGGITLSDASAIQAYMMVIHGHDPLELDLFED